MIKYILSDILIYILNLCLSIIVNVSLSIIVMSFYFYILISKNCEFKKRLNENFLKFFLKFFKCLVQIYVGNSHHMRPLASGYWGFPRPVVLRTTEGKSINFQIQTKLWKFSQTASQAQHSASRMVYSPLRRMTQVKFSLYQLVHTHFTEVATSPMQQPRLSSKRWLKPNLLEKKVQAGSPKRGTSLLTLA